MILETYLIITHDLFQVKVWDWPSVFKPEHDYKSEKIFFFNLGKPTLEYTFYLKHLGSASNATDQGQGIKPAAYTKREANLFDFR